MFYSLSRRVKSQAKFTTSYTAQFSPSHGAKVKPRPPREEGTSAALSLCDAWRRAIEQHFPNAGESPFTVLEGMLQEIDPERLRCDCVVSPANSFGIMDGGVDFVLSRSLRKKKDNFWSLTNHCQSYIQDIWHGYAPPGSCTIVPLPQDVAGPGSNPWNARCLAISPTMRMPEDVSWHQDLVYNAMWTLLVEIERWNRGVATASLSAADDVGRPRCEGIIRTVLMTGLGTGQGGIGVERCAQQMVLAVKHFEAPLLGTVRFGQSSGSANELTATLRRCPLKEDALQAMCGCGVEKAFAMKPADRKPVDDVLRSCTPVRYFGHY
ncbi:hypothetical protein F5I97DRAFT_1931046 [Phlebopus sp. FC_14]|nr:hypothetical protein F5I97DRAFT_1931046 [Phlebopus sp. FC_14]